MALWVIRAGKEGEQEEKALNFNVITIGWNNLPDLSSITNKDSLKIQYEKFHPDAKKSVSNQVTQIWNFLKKVRKGDIVAIPLKTKNSEIIAIGVIEGDYEYNPLSEDIRHIRNVKWIKNISINDLEQSISAYLKLPQTVYKVNNKVEQEILNLIPAIDRPINNDDEKKLQLTKEALPTIITEFRNYYKSQDCQKHLNNIEKEKQEVKNLLKKLDSLDKNSNEFVELVLYGLLPYSKTKFAKRVSTFPAFMNIKLFFKNYNYTENDWKIIANMIYSLVKRFQESPDKLNRWIGEFTSNTIHSRSIQCGSITPILFCINDNYPIINNRIIYTYNDFASIYGWNDVMSKKLDQYISNIDRCKKLISFLGIPEVNNFTDFDLFCYWYDYLYEKERDNEDDDDYDDNSYRISREKIKLQEVNIPQFLDFVKLDNTTELQYHSLSDPERIKISRIIDNCSNGYWVLPNFQRYFEWKKNDVKEFLESIVNDYYIGSLLFWEIGNEPQLDIIPIKGVNINKNDIRSSLIILDGQQRLTSLYYAIRAPNFHLEGSRNPVYFYINFATYLDENSKGEIIEILLKKLDLIESYKRMLFPFYELEKYSQWVDGLEDFMHSSSTNTEKIRKVRRIIDRKLRHIIDGFEIPYISLPSSMELSQITDIFERINTMGKKLSSFDLLIARLSKYDIELKKLWEESNKRYPKFQDYHRVNERMPFYVLQAISLFYNKTSACSREDILNIYQNIFEPTGMSFEEIWHEMAEYVNRALLKLENLRDGFGVKDESQLPFSPMIPILATLIKEMDLRQNKIECQKRLKIWYWSSVFSNAYSGAVDSQLTSDFKDMREWFSNNERIPRTVERARREITTINLRNYQGRGSAVYKGILSILALKGSRDFDTGQVLENVRNNDRDHIFPRSKFSSERYINSVLNMSWMSDETNRKIKRYEKPSEYLPKFIVSKYGGDEQEFLKVLETHCINKKAYEFMVKNDFDSFLNERETIILSEIENLINGEVKSPKSTLITPLKPFTNMTIMYNTIKSCEDYIYWVDRYFSREGLELLLESVNKDKVKSIKILSSIKASNERLRKSFEKFKEEMKIYNIDCEMRIAKDEVAADIHDRWILSKNSNYNIPSPDIVARGQYSEVKKTENDLPFSNMWSNSLDIISDWNEIEKRIREYQNKRMN